MSKALAFYRVSPDRILSNNGTRGALRSPANSASNGIPRSAPLTKIRFEDAAIARPRLAAAYSRAESELLLESASLLLFSAIGASRLRSASRLNDTEEQESFACCFACGLGLPNLKRLVCLLGGGQTVRGNGSATTWGRTPVRTGGP